MATFVIPAIFDMAEEISSNLDRGTHPFFEMDFPFLVTPPMHPERRHPCRFACRQPRPQANCQSKCMRKCPGKCAKMSDDFQVKLNVKDFKPEEVNVKVQDRNIIVDASHQEKADGDGFVSRQIVRRFVVPEQFDIDTVSSFLDAEGNLQIKVAKAKQPEKVERVVQIQFVDSVKEPETTEADDSQSKPEAEEKSVGDGKPAEENLEKPKEN